MRAVNWWFPPIAGARVAMLRLLAAAFVLLDAWWATTWVHDHGRVPEDLYRPVALARLLHVPAATPWSMDALRWTASAVALVAIVAVVVGRRADALARLTGVALFVLYLWWMLLAMSYGKVDHDRYGFLVLLAVLPTVRGAHLDGQRPSESAGWAVRMVQVAVVATYFLAAVAKVRYGGWGWANGATFARAIIRRGTFLVDWMVSAPWVLRLSQWGMLVLEFAAPLIFAIRRQRTVTIVVACLYGFHLVTFASLGIIFWPHLVALAAFLPLERLTARGVTLGLGQGAGGGPAGQTVPVAGDPAVGDTGDERDPGDADDGAEEPPSLAGVEQRP